MSGTRRESPVERGLWMYALLMAGLSALARTVYLASGRAALMRPLYAKRDQFSDLVGYADKIARMKTMGAAALGEGLPKFNYPAPAAWVYAFFLRGFPHHALKAYLAVLACGLLCGAVVWWKAAKGGGRGSWGLAAAIAATTVLGYPMIFNIDRGNMEGIVGLVLGAGLALFVARRYYAAAILIGLAASIKPFPGLFLLLLIRQIRYREMAVGVVTAMVAVVVALAALGPTTMAAYRGLQPGVSTYVKLQVMAFPLRQEERFEHSLLDSMKSVARAWHDRADPDKPRLWDLDPVDPPLVPPELQAPPEFPDVHVLYAISLGLTVLLFGFVLVRCFQLPVVNQMILIGTTITLLPPIAAEYTLMHLYVPFAVFVVFLMRDVRTGRFELARGRILSLLVLFAMLFSPLTFVGRYAGDVKTMLLAGLLLAAGTWRMPSSVFQELADGRA